MTNAAAPATTTIAPTSHGQIGLPPSWTSAAGVSGSACADTGAVGTAGTTVEVAAAPVVTR
ncbi:MAG: hypothetical protein ABS81_22730 [Pseudonocardia sp. SCN 72-86]|nr:MAG: hypothetical protein ABS81_22730 [Pseudonocardia sp. SCN 72-86]